MFWWSINDVAHMVYGDCLFSAGDSVIARNHQRVALPNFLWNSRAFCVEIGWIYKMLHGPGLPRHPWKGQLKFIAVLRSATSVPHRKLYSRKIVLWLKKKNMHCWGTYWGTIMCTRSGALSRPSLVAQLSIIRGKICMKTLSAMEYSEIVLPNLFSSNILSIFEIVSSNLLYIF